MGENDLKRMQHLSRRDALACAAAVWLLAGSTRVLAAAAVPVVEVWKSPSCGCCKEWITHLRANGFRTVIHDSGNAAARARLGIALAQGSCHTAQVGGYAIEGHVPASDILRLLKEAPRATGLAVPGMPVGSPGMDGAAYGGRRDPYDVLLIAKDGSASIYQSHR